jgi:hypothetical protein
MFELVDVGYSRVSDYTRYFDRYPSLMHPKGDLKDVQRPWALEATLGLVKPGGQVIDLGGAGCQLASALMETHQVTVVDPYDGSGNGLRDPKPFRKKYPKIRIVQGVLNPDTSLAGFDAVISTSVVEHIAIARHRETVEGIRKALRVGGYSVHAVDVTLDAVNGYLLGTQRTAESFVRAHGVEFDIGPSREKALADVETYFLSPLTYQLWRNGRPSAIYPWRKVISFNVVLRKLG